MSKHCVINSRIKNNYENRAKQFLYRRTPVIIRIDGKAFHTYTKNLNKPFDEGLIKDMEETTKFLCANIQGAKLGYCQSDEISILITDYDTLTTDAWFNYEVQKMTSISASLATAKFNELRYQRYARSLYCETQLVELEPITLAYFDSRVFNIPKDEVANYFLARQKDAIKNSIAMLAQSLYSHKELLHKNQADLHDMIFAKGFNWSKLDYKEKRGTTIVKVEKELENHLGEKFTRGQWESVKTPLSFDEEFFDNYQLL